MVYRSRGLNRDLDLIHELDIRQVKARVRNLLDDPQGSYLTDDFITPLIRRSTTTPIHRWPQRRALMTSAVIEVAGILPGTPNLGAYQAGKGPLSSLVAQPLRIDWKAAGDDPVHYQLIAQLWSTSRSWSRSKVSRAGNFAAT